jgi:hypothetical protein
MKYVTYWYQLVRVIITYKVAATNVKWKIDHEYATFSSSLSQTLASDAPDGFSTSFERVAVINTTFYYPKKTNCVKSNKATKKPHIQD